MADDDAVVALDEAVTVTVAAGRVWPPQPVRASTAADTAAAAFRGAFMVVDFRFPVGRRTVSGETMARCMKRTSAIR